MAKKKEAERNPYFILIIAIAFVFLLAIAFVRYDSKITGKIASLDNGGSGSGSGKIEKCCLCEYGLDGTTEEKSLFEKACDHFLNRVECTTKIKRGVTVSSYSSSCSVPRECKGKSLEYMFSGHSSEDYDQAFIDKITSICIDCPNVVGIINGCQTFANPVEAQLYLDSIKLPEGVTLSIWGAQCATTNLPGLYGGYCDSSLGCTINYKCYIKYDPCPPANSDCVVDASKTNIKCMNKGNLIEANCCGQSSTNYQGILITSGKWKYGSCISESGGSGSTSGVKNNIVKSAFNWIKNLFS